MWENRKATSLAATRRDGNRHGREIGGYAVGTAIRNGIIQPRGPTTPCVVGFESTLRIKTRDEEGARPNIPGMKAVGLFF